MATPVTLQHQINELGHQVTTRSENIRKLNLIKSRLDDFVIVMARAHQNNDLLLEHLKKKAPISTKGGARSFQVLFIVMRLISDLRQIENLSQLHTETARLRDSAIAKETITAELHSEIEKAQEVVVRMEALLAKKKTINQKIKEALKKSST